MDNRKYPRDLAEGIAMALNRLLYADRHTFLSLFQTSKPVTQALREVLGPEHFRVKAGNHVFTLQNVLNYILSFNVSGVILTSRVNICKECYRTAVPPMRPGDPCPCGHFFEDGDPSGYVPAAFREEQPPDKFFVPPMLHTLAIMFMRRFIDQKDGLKRIHEILDCLIRLFELHGDLAPGAYEGEVAQNASGYSYKLKPKIGTEEPVKGASSPVEA